MDRIPGADDARDKLKMTVVERFLEFVDAFPKTRGGPEYYVAALTEDLRGVTYETDSGPHRVNLDECTGITVPTTPPIARHVLLCVVLGRPHVMALLWPVGR